MARRTRSNLGSVDVGPALVDLHVGARIRLRRVHMGMSQDSLADALGLSFQQVQKYERGSNRVSASRLYDISRALSVSVGHFFEDLPKQVSGTAPVIDDEQLRTSRQALNLMRSFSRIKNEKLRQQICSITETLGDFDENPPVEAKKPHKSGGARRRSSAG